MYIYPCRRKESQMLKRRSAATSFGFFRAGLAIRRNNWHVLLKLMNSCQHATQAWIEANRGSKLFPSCFYASKMSQPPAVTQRWRLCMCSGQAHNGFYKDMVRNCISASPQEKKQCGRKQKYDMVKSGAFTSSTWEAVTITSLNLVVFRIEHLLHRMKMDQMTMSFLPFKFLGPNLQEHHQLRFSILQLNLDMNVNNIMLTLIQCT
jgi:hypothetical protein